MNTSEVPTPLARDHPYGGEPSSTREGPAVPGGDSSGGPVDVPPSPGEARDAEGTGPPRPDASGYGAADDGPGKPAASEEWRSWFDADSRTPARETAARQSNDAWRGEADEMVSGDTDEGPADDERAGRQW